MRKVGSRVLLIPIVCLALLSQACAGGSGASGDIEVTLSDFKIAMSVTSLQGGRVTFAASNQGPSVHEFEVFSVPSEVDPDDLPVRESVADTESQGLKVIDEVEDIAPSTTASLTVSLTPGSYALICNLPAHYEQGMHIAFTVD